ncbi:thioredoxin domain-containing protein [Spirosoma montaniterrae]|uniref:Thioredoxin domain-containing protein n=1 Tax=Spirosoma montaniterrae TaxID=1178516 RepID=A0A1P9WU61_9BACT|nr:thioredoxin domain-containing protein [Spirosoma montaniterrae]AQG78917.1 hypothetical protein AWR27_05990 [Spirosoma montaniterrae]
MDATHTTPIYIPAQTAVLLCFLPAKPQPPAEGASLSVLTDRLQQQLPPSVRLLKVDEIRHADVVKSFNLSQLPAFVLVQQGVELGRREGTRSWDDVVSLTGLL